MLKDKKKKTHSTCQASKESLFLLLNSKSQNSTAPDPVSLPPLFKEYPSLQSPGFSGHLNDFLFYPQVLDIENLFWAEAWRGPYKFKPC